MYTDDDYSHRPATLNHPYNRKSQRERAKLPRERKDHKRVFPCIGEIYEMFEFQPNGQLVQKVDRYINGRINYEAYPWTFIHWRVHSSGHQYVTIDKKIYWHHKIVWELKHKKKPEGRLRHLDGDKTNNHVSNLAESRKTPQKPVKAFLAQIRRGGKRLYLGSYATKEERDKAVADHRAKIALGIV